MKINDEQARSIMERIDEADAWLALERASDARDVVAVKAACGAIERARLIRSVGANGALSLRERISIVAKELARADSQSGNGRANVARDVTCLLGCKDTALARGMAVGDYEAELARLAGEKR